MGERTTFTDRNDNEYTYSEMASSANHSRLTKMTYPDGRILRYEYSSGLDDSISRLSFLADDDSGSVGPHRP